MLADSVDIGSKTTRSSSRYSLGSNVIRPKSVRNPILGDSMPDNSLPKKKSVPFEPSKTYDTMNKRKYLFTSEMKSLNDLYKSKQG